LTPTTSPTTSIKFVQGHNWKQKKA